MKKKYWKFEWEIISPFTLAFDIYVKSNIYFQLILIQFFEFKFVWFESILTSWIFKIIRLLKNFYFVNF